MIAPNVVLLSFDEPLDEAAFLSAKLSVDNGLAVITQRLLPSLDVVEVVISSNLEEGKLYQLSIDEFADCSGNVRSVENIIIAQGLTPALHQLAITEIMADPTPTVGLPDLEYFEVFNRTNFVLQLNGLVFSDDNDAGTIESNQQFILPEQHVVVAFSENAASAFEILGGYCLYQGVFWVFEQ